MGINYSNAKFLKYSKDFGVIFENTAMIGRQGMYISKNELMKALKCNDFESNGMMSSGFAEKMFEYLGATNVDSFDFSDYENAKYKHDFNNVIDAKYFNKYDVVFDGGTLEHVFNFPVAIKNCMNMVKIGGYFVASTICNNFCGHGFYQFSPELFFRVFSEENGFVIKFIAVEAGGVWREVSDPDVVNSRVIIKNKKETSLMLIAQKIKIKDIFQKMPLQSDYVSIWSGKNTIKNKIKDIFLRKFYNKFLKYNKKHYKKIKI